MKRIILVVTILITILIIYFINYEKSYKIEYLVNDSKIIEKYDKKNKRYSYNVEYKKFNYTFYNNVKYVNKRRLVTNIDIRYNSKNLCLSIKGKKFTSEIVCLNNNNYYKYGYNQEYISENYIKKDNLKIYDSKNYNVYVWDGFGIKNTINNKEYKVLKKEQYNNPVSYYNKDYIIFADYDNKKSFNKFYLFNLKSQKMKQWKIDYSISLSSYFMGEYDGLIYLFDKENRQEYSLNLSNKEINIVNNKDYGKVYNGKWQYYTLNKLKYTEYKFQNINFSNYFISHNNLYFKYKNNKKSVLVTNKNVDEILYSDSNEVIFRSKEKIYVSSINNKDNLLIDYFELNFNSENKIFIMHK